VVQLPLVQTFEVTETWNNQSQGENSKIRALGPCTSVVLTFCDGVKLAQQDENLNRSATADKDQDTSGAGVEPKQETEDDDDDIFGDKELEEEEEDQAKKEDVDALSTRVKAKGRGVYYVPMVSDNKVKRLRATVSFTLSLALIPLELISMTMRRARDTTNT
jgi:hypothetical protein